jgi:hypothetical protein
VALPALGWLGVSAALGQSGPDLIVGDIQEVSNAFGVAGSPPKQQYSLGTHVCNIGDQDANWAHTCPTNAAGIACNQHAVITQNMYRLMTVNGATRFEQVGQAWLGHAGCAMTGSLCHSCGLPQDCDLLHANCSDPTTAVLNGTPEGMSPKGDVNPVTGAFPYPWTFDGAGGPSAPGKRLCVATSDLDTGLAASALWFVSSMYVQPQDATLQKNDNNQSYRRATVGPAGSSPAYAMGLQDSTVVGRPAIYAWKDNGLGQGRTDPGVYVTVADVPGDGRFLIAAKATDTGATLNPWHYEYAIQNLNSDLSAQAFAVPLPANSTSVAIGFHDVDYNNGDGLSGSQPYSLSDWIGVASSTAVTWSTQTFASNPAANAIRWDTIYNFRFDSNQPPSGGTATLTLFKPGTPASVAVNTIVPSPDGLFHPLNDDCANAADVSAGTTAFSNANATTDGPDEPGSCVSFGYSQIGSDVWFRYTSGSCASGPTTVSTCGSGFDTKIAIYPGAGCPTVSGTPIACNDDSNMCGGSALQSWLSFDAQANTTYLIRIGGYNGATGNGVLTITPPSCGPQIPPNDSCSNPIFLSDGVPVAGTTVNATNDATGTCGLNTSGPDVWYAYRPTASATVNVNTCGSYPPYDTVLSVYSGSCGALELLGCNDDSYDGGNGACGIGDFASGLNVAMTGGNTYLIRVAGYNNTVGGFTVQAIGGGGIAPPINDNCANPSVADIGSLTFSNANASTDGPAQTGCDSSASSLITGDLWWTFTPTFTGQLRVDTCSAATTFDTKIAVYSGTGCTGFDTRLLGCNDDSPMCTQGRSSLTVPVTAWQGYLIRVGGSNGATGTGVLTLTAALACGSADFNGDGAVGTDADIEAFFACLSGQCCATCGSADFNGDGAVGTDADIEAFFRILSGGPC